MDQQNPQWYIGRRYVYSRVKPDHIKAPYFRYNDGIKLPTPGVKPKFYPPSYKRIQLSESLDPRLKQVGLLQCLETRRSQRTFGPHVINLDELASILSPSLGKSGTFYGADPQGNEVKAVGFDGTSYPAPGGLYSCTTYVIYRETEGGPHVGYYFDQVKRQLVQINSNVDLISTLVSGAEWAAKASAIVVICAWYGRIAEKYGAHSYRKSFIEAGHIGQNVALCATALGLKQVPLAGFDFQRLAAQLDLLETEETPIYSVVMGK